MAGAAIGVSVATNSALGQAQQPHWMWSGQQPSSVDPHYRPRRLNKAIELWEDGQPMYYVSWGPTDEGDGYEQGKKMAQTWADCIYIDLEHACFDLADVRHFMRGLVDGGPTRSGHRTPSTFCPMPITGLQQGVYGSEQLDGGGQVIADSTRALTPKEASYPAVRYIPREDARMDLLERTESHTYCPYKGEASFFSIPAAGEWSADAIWSYETPYEAVAVIKGHLAFYPNRVNSIQE